MQNRLDKEINKNYVVKDAVKVPKKKKEEFKTLEEKLTEEFNAKLKIKNKS